MWAMSRLSKVSRIWKKKMPKMKVATSTSSAMPSSTTSATQGMPLVVELGIALDVLVATFIFGIFFFQIRETFDSLDITHMEKLKDD